MVVCYATFGLRRTYIPIQVYHVLSGIASETAGSDSSCGLLAAFKNALLTFFMEYAIMQKTEGGVQKANAKGFESWIDLRTH